MSITDNRCRGCGQFAGTAHNCPAAQTWGTPAALFTEPVEAAPISDETVRAVWSQLGDTPRTAYSVARALDRANPLRVGEHLDDTRRLLESWAYQGYVDVDDAGNYSLPARSSDTGSPTLDPARPRNPVFVDVAGAGRVRFSHYADVPGCGSRQRGRPSSHVMLEFPDGTTEVGRAQIIGEVTKCLNAGFHAPRTGGATPVDVDEHRAIITVPQPTLLARLSTYDWDMHSHATLAMTRSDSFPRASYGLWWGSPVA